MPEKLTISSIEKITGVNAHTLRAWEKRHQALTPLRSPTGLRVYASEDLERVKLLQLLIDGGHSIRNLAALTTPELVEVARKTKPAKPSAVNTEISPRKYFLYLLRAVTNQDAPSLKKYLQESRTALSWRTLLFDVWAPLLAECRTLFEVGSLGALDFQLFRTRLTQEIITWITLQKTALNKDDTFLLLTPAEERSDLGTLFALALIVGHGKTAHYLGRDSGCTLAADFIQRYPAAKILIAFQGDETVGEETQKWIQILDQKLPLRNAIWATGKFSGGQLAPTKREISWFATLERLDMELCEPYPQTNPHNSP